MSPKPTPELDEDRFKRHLAQTREALESAGVPRLLAHLQKMGERAGVPVERCPFPLVGMSDEQGRVFFRLEPWSIVRLTHFVLSPNTATAFELLSFKVGRVAQSPGFVHEGSDSLPLETFSIEYMTNDCLAKAQEWRTPSCPPGCSIEIIAELRKNTPTREGIPFRGLAWCAVVE